MTAQQLTLTDALNAVGMRVITDADLAMRARDRGMRRVLEHANAAWREEAEAVLESLAASGEEFTADDLRSGCRLAPHNPNCWGGIVAGAIKRSRVVVVGMRRSAQVQGHGNRLLVLRGWRS